MHNKISRLLVRAALIAVLTLIPLSSKARIDTLAINTKMGKLKKAVVAVPDNLARNRMPVVYLLHGMYGGYTDWLSHTGGRLDKIAELYGVIIVCPDAENSFYIDSPVDPTMQYETYVAKELINAVDARYPTIASREGRAITGLSMGGHGALFLAFRHPDLYGAAGSMSGAVDINLEAIDNADLFKSLVGEDLSVMEQYSVVSQVPSLVNDRQAIIISEGNEDFLYQQNMNLHAALREHGINHDFMLSPGNHSWKFWIDALPIHLGFFNKHLFDNLPE